PSNWIFIKELDVQRLNFFEDLIAQVKQRALPEPPRQVGIDNEQYKFPDQLTDQQYNNPQQAIKIIRADIIIHGNLCQLRTNGPQKGSTERKTNAQENIPAIRFYKLIEPPKQMGIDGSLTLFTIHA